MGEQVNELVMNADLADTLRQSHVFAGTGVPVLAFVLADAHSFPYEMGRH